MQEAIRPRQGTSTTNADSDDESEADAACFSQSWCIIMVNEDPESMQRPTLCTITLCHTAYLPPVDRSFDNGNLDPAVGSSKSAQNSSLTTSTASAAASDTFRTRYN